MGKLFWVLISVMAVAVIALIVSGDSGKVMGFGAEQFAAFISMALIAAFVASGVFGRGVKLGDTAKQLGIWALIIIGLMSAYVFRFDLQDIGSRLTGGLITGSPISTVTANGGKEVTLIRSSNGHFEANTEVNGSSVRFLVDTGASGIVLSAPDADRAGIDVQNLRYNQAANTANGLAYFALAKVDSIKLGGIERKNVRVTVAKPQQLNQSLLGQLFLESLSSYEKRGDRLTLRD